MHFKSSLLTIMAIVGLNFSHGARAAEEISIPGTRQVEFVSKVNGHRYVLSVAMPFIPAPPGG